MVRSLQPAVPGIPVLEGDSSEDNTRPTSLLTVHFVYKIVMTKARAEERHCVQKGFSKRTGGGGGELGLGLVLVLRGDIAEVSRL